MTFPLGTQVPNPHPVPDAEEILRFLEWFNDGGLICLTALRDGGGRREETESFSVSQMAAAVEFARSRNMAGANVYVMLNRPKVVLKKKATKEQVAEANFLWVDLDPLATASLNHERARLLADVRAADPPFSAIIDSGGGFWGLYRLRLPKVLSNAADIDDVESRGRALEGKFRADRCRNIERIARLPGTVNWPSPRKQAAGRRPALARIVCTTDRRYDLSDFDKTSEVQFAPPAPAESPLIDPGAVRSLSIEDLDQWSVPDRVKVIILHGRCPNEPKLGDNSRSAYVMDVCCNLKRAKVPNEIVLGLLENPANGISESILEKGSRSRAYALRQIERAASFVSTDEAAFRADGNGKPLPTQDNIRLALHKLGVVVRYEEFAGALLIDGLLGAGPTLTDAAMTRLYLEVEARFGFRPTKEYFWSVVEDYARQNNFHAVRDYLDELTWDGVPRIDRWLSTYGGAEDTPYTNAVSALILVAAVRRVRQPGCKFDEMPVLESKQGKNKSSALSVLAVREEWFTDDLPLNADTQRVIERLAGRWIVEAGELRGMRSSDVESLKSFLSRRIETARRAYGRMTEVVARQSVIIGTTNSDRYLRDGTGNRRFWPVTITEFKIDALRADRDQLWAEAAAREAAGCSIRMDPSLWSSAGEQQEERCVEDPYVNSFQTVLGDAEGRIRGEDVWAILGLPAGQRTQQHNVRVGDAMRACGFERRKLRFGGPNPEWGYTRGDSSKRIVIRTDANGRAFVDRGPEENGANDNEVPF